MEKEDLFDLERKIDDIKRELEYINSELSKANNTLNALDDLRRIKNDLELYTIELFQKIKSLERTNEILNDIENNTSWIKWFGWLFIGCMLIILLKGCFGW